MNRLRTGFAFALMLGLLGLLGGCVGGENDDSVAPPPAPPPAPSLELTAVVESAQDVSLKWTAPAIYSTQGYAVYANGQAVGWTFAPDTDYLYKGPPATKTCFSVVPGRWEFYLFYESETRSEGVCVETPPLPPVPPPSTGWTILDAELSRAVDIVPSIARAPEGYSQDYLCDSAPGETFSTIRGIPSPHAPPSRTVNGTECRVVVDRNLSHLHVFTIDGSDLKYQSVYFDWAGKAVRIRAPYVNPYTGWREEVVGDGLVGARSLVVASDGTVYAALASKVQEGIGELEIHARGTDGVWSETLFDPGANAAPAPSMAVSATGETFIACGASRIDRRLLDYDLRLAARYADTGGGWELRVIDEAGNVAEKTDMARSIGPLGEVVILYSDKDGPSRIAYGP